METFLLQKIRGQVEFTSIAKLVDQMNDDLKIAQDIFLENTTNIASKAISFS